MPYGTKYRCSEGACIKVCPLGMPFPSGNLSFFFQKFSLFFLLHLLTPFIIQAYSIEDTCLQTAKNSSPDTFPASRPAIIHNTFSSSHTHPAWQNNPAASPLSGSSVQTHPLSAAAPLILTSRYNYIPWKIREPLYHGSR